MDTACARVAVSQHATPPEIEDAQRRIETLNTELEIIGREEAIGIDVDAAARAWTRSSPRRRGKLAELEPRWKAEQELVTKVSACAPSCARAAPRSKAPRASWKRRLRRCKRKRGESGRP
jgi:type VI secretion system protein VasG